MLAHILTGYNRGASTYSKRDILTEVLARILTGYNRGLSTLYTCRYILSSNAHLAPKSHHVVKDDTYCTPDALKATQTFNYFKCGTRALEQLNDWLHNNIKDLKMVKQISKTQHYKWLSSPDLFHVYSY